MLSKIDWLSFTVDIGTGEDRRSDELPALIYHALDALSPAIAHPIVMQSGPEPGHGRKPYSVSWRWPDRHITIFAHPHLPHALIEISGQGCELLHQIGRLDDVMKAGLNRLTRLDIATDMLTDTRPTVFVEARSGKRFKSSGYITSVSGETCYVGSKTSDRYARVYRYNPPHERSHLLRAEVQLRGMNARLTAQMILARDVSAAAEALGDAFGWEHEAWNRTEGFDALLKVWRPERGQGKTEFWLEAQVRPALLKTFAGRPDDLWKWFTRLMNDLVDPPTTL